MAKNNLNELFEDKNEENNTPQTGFDLKVFGRKLFNKATDVASRTATVVGRTVEGGIKGAKKGVDEAVLKGRTVNEFYDDVADPYLDALGKKINTTMSDFFEGTSLEQKYPSPNFSKANKESKGKLYQLYTLGKLVCEDKNIDLRIKSDIVEKIAGNKVKSVSGLEKAVADEVTHAATSENFSTELMQYHTQVLGAVKGKVAQVAGNISTDKETVAQMRSAFLEAYKTELKQAEGVGNYVNTSGVKGAILFIGSRMFMGPVPALVLTGVYAKKELDKRGVDLTKVWSDVKGKASEASENLREAGRDFKEDAKEFYRDLRGK
ncbi:hypothetical protein HZA97_00415 [Candidatus Woesearchaeota archaeon]|nr:hypothetical protein [Candidatus Woesearchaeota archaeon]